MQSQKQSQKNKILMNMVYIMLERSYIWWHTQNKYYQSQKLAYRYRFFVFISILFLLKDRVAQAYLQFARYIQDFSLTNDQTSEDSVVRTINLNHLHIATLNYGDEQLLNITDHFVKLLRLKHIWRFDNFLRALQQIFGIQTTSTSDSIELMLIEDGAICIDTLRSLKDLFVINETD